MKALTMVFELLSNFVANDYCDDKRVGQEFGNKVLRETNMIEAIRSML